MTINLINNEVGEGFKFFLTFVTLGEGGSEGLCIFSGDYGGVTGEFFLLHLLNGQKSFLGHKKVKKIIFYYPSPEGREDREV